MSGPSIWELAEPDVKAGQGGKAETGAPAEADQVGNGIVYDDLICPAITSRLDSVGADPLAFSLEARRQGASGWNPG